MPVQARRQPLPPIDPEADRLIADLFARNPEARYRITQMAFVQEHALVEAQNRIHRLQWELQQAPGAGPGAGRLAVGRGRAAGAAGAAARLLLRPVRRRPGRRRPPPQQQYAAAAIRAAAAAVSAGV